MDRLRLLFSLVLGVTVCVLSYRTASASGLWFDEAYTARLAALSLPRAAQGALQDIHPPGWTLIAWFSYRLPFLSPELSLRLPSVLGVGLLLGGLSYRAPIAASALLCHAVLMDQAAQGRAYVLLPLGLVVLYHLLEQRRHRWAGLLAGLVASLHTVGGLLVLSVALPNVRWRELSPRDLLAPLSLAVLPHLWWLPSFFTQSTQYTTDQWYQPSPLEAWLFTTDGPVGFAAACIAVALCWRSAPRLLLTIGLLTLSLLLPELAGVGMRPDKLGLSIVVFVVVLVSRSPRAHTAGAVLGAGLLLSSSVIGERPDMRAAAEALSRLPRDTPIATLFASEFSYYLRSPGSVWLGRSPEEAAARVETLLTEAGSDCIGIATVWGQAPDNALPPELDVVAWAPTPGMDVRLIGGVACSARPTPPGWIVGAPQPE